MSCESLGGFHATGEFTTPNIPESAKWHEKACDLGRPAACGFLAAFLLDGSLGHDADVDRAPKLLEKACDGGFPPACKLLGDAYSNGANVPQDRDRASVLYRKACSLGSKLGCEAVEN
ncbi:MAG: sel1 repeat family protein [Myxococcales bacterium]|nr:sel1 repeat family protein [Myxococcales bacterium]